MQPLWGFRNIKQQSISRLLVLLKYTIAKYVIWCLDKQLYNCFFNHLIACNIVFPIIPWYFIRDHNLFYIDCYLLLLLKVFICNLYLTKFKIRHLYYIFLNPSYDIWTYQIAKSNYLVLTKLHTFSLLTFPQLFCLFFAMPCVFLYPLHHIINLLSESKVSCHIFACSDVTNQLGYITEGNTVKNSWGFVTFYPIHFGHLKCDTHWGYPKYCYSGQGWKDYTIKLKRSSVMRLCNYLDIKGNVVCALWGYPQGGYHAFPYLKVNN